MTTYKYLGWGTTDENGVAHLDHDANGDEIQHSYTGVGAGEVDVLASLDKPITDGSIVSEIYSVLDCIWYDPLTETPLKNNWYSTNLNLNTDSDGTLITNNSSNNLYFKPYPSNADLMLDTPYVIDICRSALPRPYTLLRH